MTVATFNFTKAAYSANELIQLGVVGSRTSLYRFVSEGKLRLTKQGSRSIFLTPHVAEFLAALANGGAE